MAKKKYEQDQHQEEEEFDFLRPDITRLDEEWVNQPKLFHDYACQLADAREELDEAKAELDVTKTEFDNVKAVIDLRVRMKPAKFHIPKDVNVTENLVKQTVLRQTKCQEAQEKVRNVERVIIKVNHRVGLLGAAVHALDHRKAALERLVSLHGQSYFATPRASEDSREVVDDIEKRSARSKITKKKKKRKR